MPSPSQKKALYQASHRGTKEADLLLGGFVAAHLHLFTAEEEEALSQVLLLPDEQLMTYVLRGGCLVLPHPCLALLDRIRQWALRQLPAGDGLPGAQSS